MIMMNIKGLDAWQITEQDCDGANGLYICQDDPTYQEMLCPDYQFQCRDRTCISDISLCDGITDCPGGEDESDCGCDVKSVSSHWFGQDHYTICEELPSNIQAKCHKMSFVCPRDMCIPISYVCDGIPHCDQGIDEFCDGMLSSPVEKIMQLFE